MEHEGRIFVGGLTPGTKEEELKDYFSKYGHVKKASIVRDTTTYRPKGYAFVHYYDPTVLDQSGVLVDEHIIDGKQVRVKRSLSGEEPYQTPRTINPKQIFVGGLIPTLDKEQLWGYFETFGKVTNVVIVHDKINHKPCGFGFIHFDTEDAVTKVLVKNFHEIRGKLVEVKQAVLKNANPGSASGVNASGAFDSRMKYVQPQPTAVRYPYSGHSSPSYRYGGAYEGYGLGGYGNAGDGPCGNANTSNTLFANRPTQSPSYGASSYGVAAISGLMGQSPRGASSSRYGNHPYGYGLGGYGNAGDGPCGNANTSNTLCANRPTQSPSYGASGYGGAAMCGLMDQSPSRVSRYGNSGGEQHMRSGYIGSNGNSGYPGGSWRYDPPQSSDDYGGRYGVAQPRQNQAYGYGNFVASDFDAAGGRPGSSEEQHMRSSYRESNGNSGYQGGSWKNQQR